MAGSIITPVLNLIREGVGADPASVGLIITTHALFVAVFSPVAGNIIDRIGPKKPFILGLILYGLAGGSGLFINSYWGLIVSRAFLGIAVAAIITSIVVIILNLYEGEERNKVMGWRGSANSIGGIVWPLIGGILGSFSWHLPFAVYLVGIPLSVLVIITIPETQKEKTENAGTEDSVLKIFRNNRILFAIFGLMFSAMIFLYVLVVFVPQLLDKIGISNPFHISLFILAMAIPAALTALMYGRIKQRLSYKMIALITLALWTVAFITLSQASSGALIAVSLVPFGIGQGMLGPAIMVWVGETVAISFRGRVFSYLATLGFIGQFLSPVIMGPIALSLGLNSVFLVAGGICALLFLSFFVGMRKWLGGSRYKGMKP